MVCVDTGEYPTSLELHKIYRVLTDEDAATEGDLRVIDESGEDYIYPAGMFLPIDLPRATEKALAASFSRASGEVQGFSRLAGAVGGPKDLSLRKGFSRS